MRWTVCVCLTLSALHAAVNAPAELLAKACRSGDVKTADSLLSTGLDPNQPDQYGATPLYYAASFNHLDIVELLLEYHADPNAPVKINGTDTTYTPSSPLHYAASLGNVRIVSTLLAAGAQINAAGKSGQTPLHLAGGQVGMLHLLIEHGAEVNVRDSEGVAPLDQAVWLGSLDSVAILLAHGARLNEPEPQSGATPINEAAYRGQAAIVKYLLQFNPDLATPDKRGHTPIENAIRMGKEDSALPLLEAEGKHPQQPEFYAKLADPAIRKDESAVVEALLRHGLPANGALATATLSGAAKTVRVLLDHHADPNAVGPDGATPLENAALKGSAAIAGMLLDHGTAIDQINKASGNTALYTAASFGRTDVVKLLLDRGADPHICGANQKSPYQAAVEHGNTEAANELQSHHGAEACKARP